MSAKKVTKWFVSLMALCLLTGAIIAGCTPEPPPMERNSTGDIVPYAGLVNYHSLHWEPREADIVDDTHIRFTYQTSNSGKCERLGATVEEKPDAIVITLLSGEIPNADKLCENESKLRGQGASSDSIMVETKTPINGRKLIDGYTDAK